jgi:hypothetical protein
MAKDKKDKAEAVAPAPTAPVAESAPAKPADPRMKVYKKFRGRFLPKGPLRERLAAIQTRWDSNDDHGGVTLEELKSLLADWRASREHPKKRAAAASGQG